MINIFGEVNPPPGVSRYGSLQEGGLVDFLNNILLFLTIAGGIYTLFNIIIAGYQFLSAGGKPDDMAKAWAKIWQSLLGLLFIAGALVLGAIFGQILFGDPTILIKPKLFRPPSGGPSIDG
ncbi:hypothetical protein HY404_02535 [Candidatus Microgenomates bacterium]|nr:hypothetical protein [Candidatus Microgenomates bacterium]